MSASQVAYHAALWYEAATLGSLRNEDGNGNENVI